MTIFKILESFSEGYKVLQLSNRFRNKNCMYILHIKLLSINMYKANSTTCTVYKYVITLALHIPQMGTYSFWGSNIISLPLRFHFTFLNFWPLSLSSHTTYCLTMVWPYCHRIVIQEVPTFHEFWFQRVIMKCRDHEFWGLFLLKGFKHFQKSTFWAFFMKLWCFPP